MKFDGREDLIKSVQRSLNLKDDGVDGEKTWTAIAAKLVVKPTNTNNSQVTTSTPKHVLSENSFKLIIKYEVGGGEGYYNKALKRPCYPGGASGVTIGIGYDLGYNTLIQFATDWGSIINVSHFDRLKQHLGKTGSNAKSAIPSISDIEIPWNIALDVFNKSTLPRFIKETLRAFPGADKLHPDAFGALVSIVFNRGASVTGNSRREMLNIRNLITSKNYKAIAQEIRNMKRLWIGKGLDGLLKRRDEEASLVESCS